jgi:methylphosphotriester-DNA--protein-cysteine methyltransferase
MLAQSKYAVKEIADAAGMKNVTHLYAFLQKECGQTPGALRRNLGAANSVEQKF